MRRKYRITGKDEKYTKIYEGELKRREHLEDLGVDWTIILKLILKNYNGGVWNRINWLTIASSCKILMAIQ
jgi:hypothetical protein